jgi:hypothetical protein
MNKRFPTAAVLLFAAASLQAARPAWVRGPDPAYPDNVYVTGVGVGDDLDGARSSARAEVSKVFQARVQQVSSDQTSESSARSGGSAAVQSSQEASVSTRVSTDSLLEGVQIVDTWLDKKTRKHYALAVLNKVKVRASLSSQIAEQEATVNTSKTLGDAAASPIDKARAYGQALAAAEERDALAARRRVVDPVTPPEPDGAGTSDVRRALNDALARIQFIIDASGPEKSSLKEAVAAKVTGLGFRVVEKAAKGGDPVLKVRCKLAVEPLDRGNPSWKFFQWKGVFELSDPSADGKVLASSTPSGAEGHVTESAALAKAVTSGEQGVALEAEGHIRRYVYGR